MLLNSEFFDDCLPRIDSARTPEFAEFLCEQSLDFFRTASSVVPQQRAFKLVQLFLNHSADLRLHVRQNTSFFHSRLVRILYGQILLRNRRCRDPYIPA